MTLDGALTMVRAHAVKMDQRHARMRLAPLADQPLSAEQRAHEVTARINGALMADRNRVTLLLAACAHLLAWVAVEDGAELVDVTSGDAA